MLSGFRKLFGAPVSDTPKPVAKNAPAGFPLPSQVALAKGAQATTDMYPHYTAFRPEDDLRFWFCNKLHFPEPMPAFSAITAEGAYVALGTAATRMFAIPTAKGFDYRIVNGRIYIAAIGVTDPAEIGRRAGHFEQRAFPYFGDWDRLYANWLVKMKALIAEMDAIKVPELNEFDAVDSVLSGRGYSDAQLLLSAYDTAIDRYFMMWQYHFEFLVLGYGAYLTFFEFCKGQFPEIADRTIANMVAGFDSLVFKPDDELKRLAKLAVTSGVDAAFKDGSTPAAILAAVEQLGSAGQLWKAEYDNARDPWFNTSSGDGFYHFHRSWNDDLRIPFSAMTAYIAQVKAGKSLERPTAALKEQRAAVVAEYRSLLNTDADRATFDQMLGLAHTVFPYVEDHKFYCEHWLTNSFFNKIRQFGQLMKTHDMIDDVEDLFHLNHSEVRQYLSDLRLNWSIGGEIAGKKIMRSRIADRKVALEQLRTWTPPVALGPVPAEINNPMVIMLWGVTTETVQSWLAQQHGGTNELKGFGASPGVVEGPARVVMTVDDIGRLKDGDILVCPTTAPSWAPIFGKIKAAVSDIGGTMSHAAIVAREYGLPAVVGVGDATARIKDGQRIRVDGGTGRVTILA
jgi:pyruvate, water dikinase